MKLYTTAGILTAVVVLILGCGCSGINTSGSVSPATFLMPGFGSTTPEPPAGAPCETNGVSSTPALAFLN